MTKELIILYIGLFSSLLSVIFLVLALNTGSLLYGVLGVISLIVFLSIWFGVFEVEYLKDE